MFTQTAQYYDTIYAFKDYRREAARLSTIIRRAAPGARRLLDVACGTGMHLSFLRGRYEVEGVDISPQFVKIARRRNSGVRITQGDMTRLPPSPRYDVVVCLFSSIGYVQTAGRLDRAVRSMAGVLVPGGTLIVEPWITPSQWKPGKVHAVFVDRPDLKIARVNTSMTRRGMSSIDMHYLIGTPRGTRHCVERHTLGLFTVAEMRRAFRRAGLRVTRDSRGLTGRGLYIARKPLAAAAPRQLR